MLPIKADMRHVSKTQSSLEGNNVFLDGCLILYVVVLFASVGDGLLSEFNFWPLSDRHF